MTDPKTGMIYSALPTEPPDERQMFSAPSPENVEPPPGDRLLNGVSLTPEAVSARLGMAKALDVLGGMEKAGTCSVEKDSVYGAAVAIPQIARSSGWSKSMVVLAIRAYLFVTISYFVEILFVYYIYDSQANMNPFGGQMHLCDFAAHISSCPDNQNCQGPGGAQIPDPGALYPFDIWYTRKFLQESLVSLFPDRSDDIRGAVDPGEYGVESYYCRLLCVFVFVLAIEDELADIMNLIKLLYFLPTEDAYWVSYEPAPGRDKDAHGRHELESVRFVVNGMPARWKFINIFILLIPRIFIWRMLAMAGVNFLMETAAMVDQIVNTTALAFVLTTDELVLERLTTRLTRHIMERLEDYERFDHIPYQVENDEETLERYTIWELSWLWTVCDMVRLRWLLPRRLFMSLILMTGLVFEYYYHVCEQTEDGSWVSIAMFLPSNAHLQWSNFLVKFFSVHHMHEGSQFWSMPAA